MITANQTATLATVQQLDPIKDTGRLRKYLAHFDLDWASLGARPLWVNMGLKARKKGRRSPAGSGSDNADIAGALQ